MIKYAYKKTISKLPWNDRKLISTPIYYSTEVFGFSHGSFTVKLRSKSKGDLVGHVELDRCMETLGNLFLNAGDLEKELPFLKENRGHFVTSFAKLLNLLVIKDCSMRIRLRNGPGNYSQKASITRDEAVSLKSAIAQDSQIQEEIVELEGYLTDIQTENEKRHVWTLRTDDGDSYHGEVDIETYPTASLSGLTARTVRYFFQCKEEITEDSLGRQKTILKMFTHRPAPPNPIFTQVFSTVSSQPSLQSLPGSPVTDFSPEPDRPSAPPIVQGTPPPDSSSEPEV